jgi:RimJ/RimL family protein N-acetyltransferase
MQREWIEFYKKREAEGREFYFVIVNDLRDVGLVRIYDFRENPRSFCWGSWIIRPPRAAGLVTFSAIMIYEIGFDAMEFPQSHFEVRNSNAGVIAFHRRSGAEEVGKDDNNTYFIFDKLHYHYFRERSAIPIALHRTACHVR